MPRRRRFRPNLPLWGAISLVLLLIVGYVGTGDFAAWLTPKRIGLPDTLYLTLVAKCLDATLAVWFFAVGASIGSFLNVVAYRLPLGKTLGGHSACPYCTTPIRSTDNIPVLAWLKLRGRCRACRLPISIQYPLVELVVGILFLSIYFTEFGRGGTNLPGSGQPPSGLGLVWMSVSRVLMARVLLYAYVLSGLIAAALMILRRSRPPVSLYLWLAWPLCLAAAIEPTVIVMPWDAASTRVITHFDVVVSLSSGLASGSICSALTLPLFSRPHNAATEAASPHEGEHTLSWMGTAMCWGLLLGWQAVPMVMCLTLLCTWLGPALVGLVPGIPKDNAAACHWREPVVWAWLGTLLFRANWKSLQLALESIPWLPTYYGPLLPLVAALLVASLIGSGQRGVDPLS